ncbi:hypothetical protein IJJ39_01830 [Candidatus Saccharibacteria bacterium]|nr:hypothetical protein [Candidatus Saccharibacteria bacterium]
MKKFNKIISLALALTLSLALAIPAHASVATGNPVLDEAFELGIVKADDTGHYREKAIMTKGEFMEMLIRAYLNIPEVDASKLPHADEPATLDFIKLLYEVVTDQPLESAPFWRELSNGGHIARIEGVNLVVRTLAAVN